MRTSKSVFLILVMSTIGGTVALRCFDCTGGPDRTCGAEPFNTTALPYVECESSHDLTREDNRSPQQESDFLCEKTTVWVERKAVISRRCSAKHWETDVRPGGHAVALKCYWEGNNVEKCLCSSDYCNSTIRTSASPVILAAIISLLHFSKYISQ